MKKNKIIAAAVTAGLLLLGGGSYAVWKDSTTFSEVKFQTGYLNVSALPSEWTIYHGTDKLSYAEYKDNFIFVPQTKVQIYTPVTVELKGNDLVAKMNVDLGTKAGKPLDSLTVTPLGWFVGNDVDAAKANLQKTNVNDDGTEITLSPTDKTGSTGVAGKKFYIGFELAFDDTVTEGTAGTAFNGVNLSNALEGVTVSLTQQPVS